MDPHYGRPLESRSIHMEAKADPACALQPMQISDADPDELLHGSGNSPWIQGKLQISTISQNIQLFKML